MRLGVRSFRVPGRRPRASWVRFGAGLVLSLAACVPGAFAQESTGPSTGPFAIRITSPLGRTGIHGTIRLVAQVEHAPEVRLLPVRFFVDQRLQGEAPDGPPYAVDWIDENPYEAREIAAEVCNQAGICARDLVRLEPLFVLEETEVSSVLIEASVLDRTGRSVNGLGAEHFRLFEDDVLQTLDLVRADVVDSTYTLLVDSSQSMARRIDFVRHAAGRLLAHLRPGDRAILAPFSKNLGPVTGPTDDRATIVDGIGAIRARGGTAILDALNDLPRLLEGANGRQAVVLITDGYDEHSARSLEDATRAIKAAQATLFVVGVGGVAGISLKGERLLRALAEESGGRAFFPSRDEELVSVHETIAADLRARYLIAYTPTNTRVDGAWRRVALTTTDAAQTVRARPGYFAPRPPPVRATLEFTIANRAQQPVEVAAADLEILEDGVPQTLESFQEAVAPVSIVLALDASGSMKGAVDAVKDGAKQFVNALRPQDRLALIVFSDTSTLVHDLTAGRTSTLTAIDQYTIGGGTALNDALFDALTRLRAVDGRRAVVVLTDGRDENGPGTAPGSRHTVDEVLDELRTVDATIYAIGLGARVDRAVLERLGQASGGESFFPEAVDELAAEYRRVVEHLRRRYVATYISTNAQRDGRWRSVDIRSRDPLLEIRSRGGYQGPSD